MNDIAIAPFSEVGAFSRRRGTFSARHTYVRWTPARCATGRYRGTNGLVEVLHLGPAGEAPWSPFFACSTFVMNSRGARRQTCESAVRDLFDEIVGADAVDPFRAALEFCKITEFHGAVAIDTSRVFTDPGASPRRRHWSKRLPPPDPWATPAGTAQAAQWMRHGDPA